MDVSRRKDERLTPSAARPAARHQVLPSRAQHSSARAPAAAPAGAAPAAVPLRAPPPPHCHPPGRKLLPRRRRRPRLPGRRPGRRPGTWHTRGGGGGTRRPSGAAGRGVGAQMGATEKGGKKSRRLFSSLRPWKATRRLWRTRSAPKAAQGECGRSRGTCYGARAPGAALRAKFSDPGGPAGRSCTPIPGRGNETGPRAHPGPVDRAQGPVSALSAFPLHPAAR